MFKFFCICLSEMCNSIALHVILSLLLFHFPFVFLFQVHLISDKNVNWISLAMLFSLILVLPDFFERDFVVNRVYQNNDIGVLVVQVSHRSKVIVARGVKDLEGDRDICTLNVGAFVNNVTSGLLCRIYLF